MKHLRGWTVLLALCAMLTLPCAAGAVPAYSGLIEIREPATGLRINACQVGDEFFSYCTDEQGALLELDAEGYFRRVVRDGGGYALGGYVTQDGADLYALHGESVLQGDAGLREKLMALRGSLRAAMPMLLVDEGNDENGGYEGKWWLYEHLEEQNDAAAGHWVEVDGYISSSQYAPRGETVPLLVLRLSYEDVKSVFSDQQWHDRIFEGGVPAYYTEVSGGRFTYVPAREKSGTVNDGVVSVTLPFRCPRYQQAEYGSGGVEGGIYTDANGKLYGINNDSMLFAYALFLADGAVDFEDYDTNGDGRIDPTELAVTVIQPGLEASVNSYMANGHAGVWAHSSYIHEILLPLMIRLDGVCLYKFTITAENVNDFYYYAGDEAPSQDEGTEDSDAEDSGAVPAGAAKSAIDDEPSEPEQPQQPKQAQFGTICHELGHDLGLMDLYDLSYTDINAGGGELSLMSGGNRGAREGGEEGSCPTHLDPYSKIRLGFYEATEATADGSVVLYAAGDNPTRYNILKIPSSEEGVYFLVENRQLAGFDEGLFNPYGFLIEPLRGGLAVWRIDENVIEKYWQENRVNSNPSEQGVVLLWTQQDPYATYYDENMRTPFYRDGMRPLYLEMASELAVQAKGHGMAMSAVVTGLSPAPTPQPPEGLPQTGDSSHLTLWLLLLAASCAGLIGMLLAFKRRNR